MIVETAFDRSETSARRSGNPERAIIVAAS
jgi:hypothetical protein